MREISVSLSIFAWSCILHPKPRAPVIREVEPSEGWKRGHESQHKASTCLGAKDDDIQL